MTKSGQRSYSCGAKKQICKKEKIREIKGKALTLSDFSLFRKTRWLLAFHLIFKKNFKNFIKF